MEKNKILNEDELSSFSKSKKTYKKKIVLAHGVFDLLHIGHINYLKSAKKLGDILVVSITADKFVNKGPGRPYFSEINRLTFLASLYFVDYVVISNETTSVNIIQKLKPNLYVKGSDYKNSKDDLSGNLLKEIKAVKSIKGNFKVINEPSSSSSKLLNKSFIERSFNHQAINKDLKKNYHKLLKYLEEIRKDKILVMGEVIIDIFTHTKSLGKSRKNNLISTRYIKQDEQLGGVLFLINNLSEYFQNIHFLIPCKISEFKKIKKLFHKLNLIHIETSHSQFVIKNRFIDFYNLNKIFQVNNNDKLTLLREEENKIDYFLRNNLNQKKFELFVIIDFGHGLFTPKIVKTINALKIKKFVNCQANSSNFGFNKFTKYKNINTITSDEDEFRLSVESDEGNLKDIIKEYKKSFKLCKNFYVTAGKNGSYYFSSNKNEIQFTESFVSRNIVDSIGSGDTYYSYIVLLHKLKISESLKMYLAHLSSFNHSNVFANSSYHKKSLFIKSINSLIA